MNSYIGLGILPFLLAFTFILGFISTFTKEYPMILASIMIVGDICIVGLYYFMAKSYFNESNIKSLNFGIGLSFMILSLFRAVYFLINQKKFNL